MFWQRVLSAIVFAPVMLLLAYLGGYPLLIGVLALTIIGLFEYRNVMAAKEIIVPHRILMVIAFIFIVTAFVDNDLLGLAVSLAIGILAFWTLKLKVPFSSFAIALCGVVYICWGMCHIMAIRQVPEIGTWCLILAFIIPWLTDAGAYLVGVTIGRHKLIPTISPKKTWEGAIGGTIICVLGCLIYNYYLLHAPVSIMLAIALLGAILGQMGDLLESWMKRWAGLKDSGKLLPGHGGMLDRFDSMLFVAPFIYYCMVVMLRYSSAYTSLIK